ncbi:FAD-binding oxidoreductase [Bdellovibrionota bacterium FG-1]
MTSVQSQGANRYSNSYWMEVPILTGNTRELPSHASVAVIGSGLTGASVGYFLNQRGFEDVVIIDDKAEESASYRNCGHILFGTVESMKAMVEIHGETKAKELWQHSIDICNKVEATIQTLGIDAEYRRDGYLVISVSEVEDRECRESVELLNRMGFQSDYVDAATIQALGFRKCFGARFEAGSAQAHPVKFRNGVLEAFLKTGGQYYSNVQVLSLDENSDGVEIKTARGLTQADAVVIAANAYSPLFSDFFKSRGLIDPFRGQMIASKPLRHDFKVKYPHSFDHGYEYAIISADNRLVLGGWRNHSETGEVGTYSLETNPHIEQGLKNFAQEFYDIHEEIQWEYSWSGIMAASRTGLPFIGNTTSQRIYSCAGYTGHGFSWGHGSAELLADIISGGEVSPVARFFNPKAMI